MWDGMVRWVMGEESTLPTLCCRGWVGLRFWYGDDGRLVGKVFCFTDIAWGLYVRLFWSLVKSRIAISLSFSSS